MNFKKQLKTIIICSIASSALMHAYHEYGYQYLHPMPGTMHAYPKTTLILRFEKVTPSDIQNLDAMITVTDQAGLVHHGFSKIASDKKTVIFTPDQGFQPGETVTVSLSPELPGALKDAVQPLTYLFTVSSSIISPPPEQEKPDAQRSLSKQKANGAPRRLQAFTYPNGVSVPGDFPQVEITWKDNPDDGYIFIDNRGGNMGWEPAYNIIFDNNGCPIWYLQTPDERRDFKVQQDGLASMMIRWGFHDLGWDGSQGFVTMNEKYEWVRTYHAAEGFNHEDYYTDEHEFLLLDDGGYLIIGRREEWMDLTEYGGQPNSNVLETSIQEFTADDDMIFFFAAWDHYDIRDCELSNLQWTGRNYMTHMNSIDIDDDGHLIVSNRELSEISKIHRQNETFIWRLGGKYNQFTWIDDDELQGPRNQHTARVLGNNVYLMFDNGNGHDPRVSRAVKYQLNTDKMTATKIWEYRETPDVYSQHMGNIQQLPNGNVLINWAQTYLPKLTEVRPDGSKAFEMNFVDRFECYRVHRGDWNGMSEEPRLEYEQHSDRLTLIFNKFGDPDVDYYRIYNGTGSNPASFDTSTISMKTFTEIENGHYDFRVKAVGTGGQSSGFSNMVSLDINIKKPGENLVNNGDFSEGEDDWTWQVQGSGQADWSVTGGEARIAISDGGFNDYDLQLRQNCIPLSPGKYYIFEFDARADATRLIEAKIGQDQSPYTNYSKSTYFSLKSFSDHFTWEFEMEDPTDANARVVFNMGNSNIDVYLDNISVTEKLGQWPYEEAQNTIPGTIRCAEYDHGGEGVSYHDESEKQGDTEFRPADNVDMDFSEDGDGGYCIGWADDGEWLEYTISAQPGTYDIEFRTASDVGGGSLKVILDDRTLTVFDAPNTGGWDTWETLIHSGIVIFGGENLVLRLEIIGGAYNLNWLKFTRTGSGIEAKNAQPREYRLYQNAPNPFNPETRIDYHLPEYGHVSIQVVNVLGEHVMTLIDQKQEPGNHHVVWNGLDKTGRRVESGIYWVRMTSGDHRLSRKIMLIK